MAEEPKKEHPAPPPVDDSKVGIPAAKEPFTASPPAAAPNPSRPSVFTSPPSPNAPPGSPPRTSPPPASPPRTSPPPGSPPRTSPPVSTLSSYGSPPIPRPSPVGSPSPPRSPLVSPAPSSPYAEEAAATSRAAGFEPDSVKGEDQLDVRHEALTLAMVLAHKDVEPPISVGLFGDWGSGKSFFMAEMRALIAKLSDQSRKTNGRFCEHVVQLEFNAWHYMDSDLWASLAREIFEGLTSALADRENPDLDLQRERLRAATRSTKDLIAATELQVVGVQSRLTETERQLTNVEQQQASIQDVAQATVAAVLQTPDVERKLRDAASDLKLDEAGRSVSELNNRIEQLTGLARLARALSVSFGQQWKGLLIGLLLVLAAGAFLFVVISRFSEQIAATMTRITLIAGAISAALATVGRSAKAVLDRVSEFRQSLDDNLTRQRNSRAQEIRARQIALDEERRQLDAQRKRHQDELDRLKKLSSELGRLDASRQLADFIRQRDASSDYRAQLGTIARASQDFERLSDLMERAAAARKRKAEGRSTETDEEDAKLPQIDRIVLYIDDLDRCPEAKVVQVLQAVHLLLAYPLFVVVVGVDPRWLLHSLEEHSGAFRISIEHGDGRKADDDNGDDWHSTSLNYLEKIFQIPYTLRPMNSDGFARLVNALSAAKAPPAAGAVDLPALPPDGDAQSPPPMSPVAPLAPSPVSPVLEDGEILLDANPPALELDDRERVFMARLYDLIPTPRAAKRFVNVYRLIRASIMTPHELHAFLDTREFAAVQVLLGIVTGAPAEASEILRALLALPEVGAWNFEWWELVDNVVKPRIDRPSWRRLAARLRPLRADYDVPSTCEAFRKWADDVARYSFYSGRVLLEPQRLDSEGPM